MNYLEMVKDLSIGIFAMATAIIIAVPVIFLLAFYVDWLTERIFKKKKVNI